MSKIEIHIITYNEEKMIRFTIEHYKKMFGDPIIIIHDNNSTDLTAKIALNEGCLVVPFTTDGMNDTVQSQIKSNAALQATCDWVLLIDADEECFINSQDLLSLEKRGINIVRFDGWNIFDEVTSPWEIQIPMGSRSGGYSKPVLIKAGIFNNIHFTAGAHDVMLSPPGNAIWSDEEFKLLHYKHWSCNWNIERSAELGSRQSEENIRNNHSYHFGFPKELHENYFKDNYNKREVIPGIEKYLQ